MPYQTQQTGFWQTAEAAISCKRTNSQKGDCKCELVGFRCLEELGSKIHFCFENRNAILFPSLWFHARKLDYWLSFLVMEVRRQDKGYTPNSLFNLVAGIQRFIREKHQWI